MRAIQAVAAMAAMAPAVAYADISEGPYGDGGIGIVAAIIGAVVVIAGGVWFAWRKRSA